MFGESSDSVTVWEAQEHGLVVVWRSVASETESGLAVAWLEAQSGIPIYVCQVWTVLSTDNI